MRQRCDSGYEDKWRRKERKRETEKICIDEVESVMRIAGVIKRHIDLDPWKCDKSDLPRIVGNI